MIAVNFPVIEHLGLFRCYGYSGKIKKVSANLAHCMLLNPALLRYFPQSLQNWMPGLELSLKARQKGFNNLVVGDALAQLLLPQVGPAEQRAVHQWILANMNKF